MRSGTAWIAMLSLLSAPLNGPAGELGPAETAGVEPGLYGIAALGITRSDPSALTFGFWGGSRVGLEGDEELGASMDAVFKLEPGFGTTDSGRIALQQGGRQALVDLSGRFGTVALGRQFPTSDEVAGIVGIAVPASLLTILRGRAPHLLTTCTMCFGALRAPAATNGAKSEGSPATGPTRAWSVSLDLTFVDKDYGRPLRVLGPTYQQNIDIEYRLRVLGTIGLNSWADLGLTKTNSAGRYAEWDTSVYWRHDVHQAGSLELGYIRFDYPGQVSSPWTHEVYAKVRIKFFLTPHFAAYRDVGPYEGWYLKAGASLRFGLNGLFAAMTRDVSFELGSNLSWGDDRTIRRFFLHTDNRSSASLIGASQTATLHVPLYRSGSFSGALSPYCTLLERIASTAHPRTSWVFGFTLNLSL